MARSTRMPERLLELYAALGNDTLLIKECIARATLVGRLTRDPQAFDPTLREEAARLHGSRFTTGLRHRRSDFPGAVGRDSTRGESPKATAPSALESAPDGAARDDYGTICTSDAWTSTSLSNAPFPREFHSGVWTGAEMIVWGGFYYDYDTDTGYLFDTGGRYDPSTDTWSPTSTAGAPSPRGLHTAVWTGSRMVVWGGSDFDADLTSGGRYDPATNSWTSTATTGAPSGRSNHTAVWTGSRMIVWGGDYYDGSYHELNTGGQYDPTTDTWTSTSTGANVPVARTLHTAVWTGNHMVVWGGWNGSDLVNSGARYDPVNNTWTPTSTTGAPPGVELHTAVWTGSRMVVWGGWDGFSDVDTGGVYNPTANSWTLTSATGAPSPRDGHTAVWTGSRMVVWGGGFYDGVDFLALDTGGWYDPVTDSWTPTSLTGTPEARFYHTAVWTGAEMLVWGGGGAFVYFDSGGNYSLGTSVDNDGDGLSICQGDCDDSNSTIYPGAIEVCNGYDDDCDTIIDPGDDALCDDDDLCTIDTCNGGGGCSNLVDTCGDVNACTADTCDPAIGCLNANGNLDSTSFSETRVDGRDLVVLADAWNSCPTDPPPTRYDPAADLDPTNPCIEDTDFHLFMTVFGRSCS